jgi:hypothetical protein
MTDKTPAPEDAWAHTAEHREQVARGLSDIRDGRVQQLGPEDLDDLADAADDQHGWRR